MCRGERCNIRRDVARALLLNSLPLRKQIRRIENACWNSKRYPAILFDMGGRYEGGKGRARALAPIGLLFAMAAVTACGNDSTVKVGQPNVPSGSSDAAAILKLEAMDLGDTSVRFGQSSVDGLVPGLVRADGKDQGDVVLVDVDQASVGSAGIPGGKERWIVLGTTLLNERYLVADLYVCDSPFETRDNSEFCESGNPTGREVWAQQRASGEWIRTVVEPEAAVSSASLLAGGRVEFRSGHGSATYVGQPGTLFTLDLDEAFERGVGAVIEQDGSLDARCTQGGTNDSSLEIVDGQPMAVVLVDSNSGDTERLPLPDGLRLSANAADPPSATPASWYCGVRDGFFIVDNGREPNQVWNLRDLSKGPWEIGDTSPITAAADGRLAVLLYPEPGDTKSVSRLSVVDQDGTRHWIDLGALADDQGIELFSAGGAIFVESGTGDLHVVS